MEKNAMLTNESQSDFNTKKAEFYDEDGFLVADEQNKHKLKNPKPVISNKEEQ
jgi:hypothetical protein